MKLRRLSFIILGLLTSSLRAKEREARSYEKLQLLLAKAPYTVVVFYDNSREHRKNKELKQKIRNLQVMFRAVSKDSTYKEANLQFIKADISRSNLAQALRTYGINTVPQFLLFLGRERIKGQALKGFIYRDDLERFINQNLKGQMQQQMKEKEQARKRELQEAKIRAYNRPYWGSPYWYYGYYPYWWGPYRYGYW